MGSEWLILLSEIKVNLTEISAIQIATSSWFSSKKRVRWNFASANPLVLSCGYIWYISTSCPDQLSRLWLINNYCHSLLWMTVGKKVKPHSGKVPHMPLSCIIPVDKAKFSIYCTRAVVQKELRTKHSESTFRASFNKSVKFLNGELRCKTSHFLLVFV